MKKITVVSALMLICISLWSLKPAVEYSRHPDMFALKYKTLNVTTGDSLQIACWFFPAQEIPSRETIIAARNDGIFPEYSSAKDPMPTIIVANGDAGNMGNQLNFVIGFCSIGYNVVLFDWRGFGESDYWEAASDQLCYKEYIYDYSAVVNAVFEQQETDQERVALYGGSTGAYLSFAAAALDERVSIVILRAILTSFDDVLPGLRAAKPDRDLKAPEEYPLKLLPVNIAASYKRPVFLIVGEKDNVTPVEMSKKIHSLLKGKKELWIVPNAEHGGEKGPVYSDFDKFTNKVDTFLKANW